MIVYFNYLFIASQFLHIIIQYVVFFILFSNIEKKLYNTKYTLFYFYKLINYLVFPMVIILYVCG